MDGNQRVHRLGSGKEAQAGVAAGIAHGQSQHVGRLLRAVGIVQVARQVDGVVQRDDGGALGSVGQESGDKVEIGDGRVGIRLVERGVVAHLGHRLRVLLAIEGPGKLRVG